MLDVHPPHAAAHTWRDFFIHIATIAVGLLLAIALEQTVEYFHHRYEVRETRAALVAEREENRRFFAVNTADFNLATAKLENNLRILLFLKQHPGTPEEKLPGTLRWSSAYEPAVESVWKNAQQTQVLSLFPRQEAEDDANLYKLLEQSDARFQELYPTLVDAESYALVDPNVVHMTPVQLDAEIDLTRQALTHDLQWGTFLDVTHRYFPEFSPAPSEATLRDLQGAQRNDADKQRLAPANAITDADLAPFFAARVAAKRAAGDTH